MADEPYVAAGRVVKTHGLKGEVSAVSHAEASLALLSGSLVWFVPPPRGLRSARLTATRPGPKGTLLTFEGVSDIDRAAQLVGCEILVRAEDLPDGWLLIDDEDLHGFSVIDSVRGDLGRIEETIHTGANDVWVVQGPLGEILVPVIDDVVHGIDSDARRIEVTLLPGLIDEEGS
jgi:16S rRNA processing protein RimM